MATALPDRRPADRLTAGAARRIALAAQGFGAPRPAGPVGARHVRKVLDTVRLLQIDSVNVLVRSHYLPLFARLGAYPSAALDRMARHDDRPGERRRPVAAERRELFEYWGHEASLLPVRLQPLLRWRMSEAERGIGLYKGLVTFARERQGFVARVLEEVAERGPLIASDLTEGGKSTGSWWGWSPGKTALEWLFWTGALTTGTRRNFERVYDLSERALPRAVIEAPTPAKDEAQRALLLEAAAALGVASEFDLRDYFRLPVADTRARLAELVEAGALLPVAIEGLDRPMFLDPKARRPRRIEAAALLSPFDSLIWDRARTERLLGFRHRLELYTPGPKRQFGYYVLPFLLGDRIVARIDVKADRASGRLLVHAAHLEPPASAATVARPLADELRQMADWLGLERVEASGGGELSRRLAGELKAGGPVPPAG